MTLQALRAEVRSGAIDTVIVALPDPFGRLVGKRFRGEVFLESVLKHGTHGCNYLLTVNMEMDPLDGFKIASWEAGFGDFTLRPDVATLRILPWQPGAALVFSDHTKPGGALVAEAPRSVLRGQVEALAKAGMTCLCASELEFYLFNQTYHSAHANGYRDLQPSSDYRIDYHLMQPTRDEPLMRAIRNGMTAARVPVESSKGEWSRGQHEINFVCTDPLAMADMHSLFKQGVKEIADQHGKSVSFMAKYAPGEAGNSCHIHISVWKGRRPLFWDGEGPGPTHKQNNTTHSSGRGGPSTLFRQFLGGLMKYSPEFCLFYAPTINSYKRFQPGSWAPTRMAWALDNRTVGFRVVGEGSSFRIENRMPGADANPYLAFAAMLAAGRAGIAEELDCGEEYLGNAYVDKALPRLPSTLRDATDLFAGSALARSSFGDDVVDFYAHHARLEIEAFNNAVTDWEKHRYFERI
jgi:glutamine synthetase